MAKLASVEGGFLPDPVVGRNGPKIDQTRTRNREGAGRRHRHDDLPRPSGSGEGQTRPVFLTPVRKLSRSFPLYTHRDERTDKSKRARTARDGPPSRPIGT